MTRTTTTTVTREYDETGALMREITETVTVEDQPTPAWPALPSPTPWQPSWIWCGSSVSDLKQAITRHERSYGGALA